MTGIDLERLERRRRWAAEQLGLSPNASTDEVRATWLRRLPEDDFVPSSESCWALKALLPQQAEGEWAARADEAALVAEEEQLRGEVEAFAEQFWDAPPDERRRRWQELTDRSAFAPALRARLRLLESGLTVESRESSKDAGVVELADHVRELFVLRPVARARARQDILRRVQDDRKAWKVAARRLRRADPRLAALGADLLDKIVTAQPTPKRPHKKSPLRLAESSSRPATSKTEWNVPNWLKVASMLVGGFLGIMGGFLKDKSQSPPTFSSPPIQFPRPRMDGDKKPPTKEWEKPKVWKKPKDFRRPTNEEFDKIIEEDMRRREEGEPGIILDKMDKKNP